MTQFDKPIEHERQSLRPMADEIQLQPQQRPRPSQPQPRPRPPSILGRYGFAPSGSIYEKEKYKRDLERWNKENQKRREANPELAQALDDIAMGVIDPGSKATGVAKGAKALLRKFAPGSDKWIESYLKGIKESGVKWSKEARENILEHLNRRLYLHKEFADKVPIHPATGQTLKEAPYMRDWKKVRQVPLALDERLQRETTNIAEWGAKPGPLRHMGLDPTDLSADDFRKLDKYVKKTLPEKYKTSLLEADEEVYKKMREDADDFVMDLNEARWSKEAAAKTIKEEAYEKLSEKAILQRPRLKWDYKDWREQ